LPTQDLRSDVERELTGALGNDGPLDARGAGVQNEDRVVGSAHCCCPPWSRGNCHAEREEGAATSQVAEWEGASSKRPRDSIPRANLEMLTGYRPPADWHPAARITGSAS